MAQSVLKTVYQQSMVSYDKNTEDQGSGDEADQPQAGLPFRRRTGSMPELGLMHRRNHNSGAGGAPSSNAPRVRPHKDTLAKQDGSAAEENAESRRWPGDGLGQKSQQQSPQPPRAKALNEDVDEMFKDDQDERKQAAKEAHTEAKATRSS